jgi:hypothetical protein
MKNILMVVIAVAALYGLTVTGGLEWAWKKSDVIGACLFAYWAFYRLDKAESEVLALQRRVATLEYQVRTPQRFHEE